MEVFLSYARSSSRRNAEAVYHELGGDRTGLAFLDTEDIEYGDHFPKRLIEALLASRIVVVFADPIYFTRWYCLLEYRAARAAFDYLSEQTGVMKEEREKALESMLVVLPAHNKQIIDDWHFPPGLQIIYNPDADHPRDIAALIHRRLEAQPPTLSERIDRTVGVAKFTYKWLEVPLLLSPEEPYNIRYVWPQGLPPSIRERFVGRSNELWRIHDRLMTPQGKSQSITAISVAIEGGGGVGKTRLALEYLYRYGPRYYPGGLFWIEAERFLETQYYQIIQALEENAPTQEDLQKEPNGILNRLKKAFLKLPPEKPALVIINNIPEPLPNEPPKPLYESFPISGNIRLITTSRRHLPANTFSYRLQIDVLDIDAAVQLLTNGIESNAQDEITWRNIAERVGRLPLALELLNSVIDYQAFTPKDLLDQMQASGITNTLDRGMEAIRNEVDAGSIRGITEAFTFSYDLLPDKAKEAARLFAWLAPEPIPTAIIEQLDIEYSSRAALVSRSYVNGAQERGVRMFGSMHRVLSDFLRTKCEDRFNELIRVSKALFNIIQQMNMDALSEAEWELLQACEPHLVKILEHLSTQQTEDEFIAPIAALSQSLIKWLLAQGLTKEAVVLAEQALAACSQQTKSGELQLEVFAPILNSLFHIAVFAYERGARYDKAEPLRRDYLAALQQIYPDNDINVLAASDNLANMLRLRGKPMDLEEAQGILEHTIPLWKQHDPNSRETLAAMNNLALVLQMQGNKDAFTSLMKEVQEGLQHLENVEVEAITTKIHLASSETNPELRRALIEEALKIAAQKRISDKNKVVFQLLKDSGAWEHNQGNYLQAKPLLHRVVQVLASTFGNYHPETTVYAWALFDAQVRTNELSEATETQKLYLDWLRTADEQQLTDEQQRIRNDVIKRSVL